MNLKVCAFYYLCDILYTVYCIKNVMSIEILSKYVILNVVSRSQNWRIKTLFFFSQHTNQISHVLIYFVEEFCWTHWNFTGISSSPADLFAALLLYLSALLFLFSFFPKNIVPWGFCRLLSFLHVFLFFFYCLDLSSAVFVMGHLLLNLIGKCNFREKKSCKFWKRVSFVNTWTFAKSIQNLNVEIWKPNNNELQLIHVKRDIWQTCCVISGLRY